MDFIIHSILIIIFILFIEHMLRYVIEDYPFIRFFIAVCVSCFSFLIFSEETKKLKKLNQFEKIEFIVEKKEKISNFLYDDYYLKSNKGIISVDKIDYYNFDKGDTLIIKDKELNESATILDYRKAKK